MCCSKGAETCTHQEARKNLPYTYFHPTTLPPSHPLSPTSHPILFFFPFKRKKVNMKLLLPVLVVFAVASTTTAFLLPSSPTPSTCSWSSNSNTRLGASIYDDINAAMKQAMKDKAKEKLSALRNIKSAFGTALKEEGAAESLPDEKAIAILTKLRKQRLESIEMFQKGNRDDMVQAERAELVILETYLPQLADEATTREWVAAAIDESGAKAKSDMGKVMGVMMKKHKGKTDNKLVSKLVGEMLG